jgi:hypothetical protein
MCTTFAACPGENPVLVRRTEALETEVTMLKVKFMNLARRYFGEKACSKDADQIIGFMTDVQRGSVGTCNPVSMEKALPFMSSQPVAIVLLDPARGLSSIHPARDAFIRDELLNARYLHPWTRLLILVQPHGASTQAERHSQSVAQPLIDKLRSYLPAEHSRVSILGPHLLPCNLRTEAGLQKLYGGPQFLPSQRYKVSEVLPGEPLAKQPRVRIWIFRVDCP